MIIITFIAIDIILTIMTFMAILFVIIVIMLSVITVAYVTITPHSNYAGPHIRECSLPNLLWVSL